MTDIPTAARMATAAKVLSDAAKYFAAEARETLTAYMRSTGAERVRVSGDDGTNLGAVSLSQGRLTPRVTDEDALRQWVLERHPEAMKWRIDPLWLDRLLSTMAKLGDPADPETGEVIPGVELVRGEPYLTVRPTAEARERMSTLLASAGLLELEAGDGA